MNQEKELLHPISFRSPKSVYLLAALGIFATGAIAVASFVAKNPDLSYNIQRQPIIQKLVKVEYSLRSQPEVKAVEVDGISIKTPGQYYMLPEAKWVPQTFNNCGPAAVSMTLQYFGYSVSQEETKAALRTNPDDKNVFAHEIVEYLQGYGIESKILFNGDRETLKTLIANGIYVVVENFLHPDDDIGHVMIIRGYDDAKGVYVADDSYFGVNIRYPYEEFEQKQWKPFNREYLPVYTRENEALVKAIVGENWSEQRMYEKAVSQNQRDIEANANDTYAWFNLGTSYFALGRFAEAKEAFEKSRGLGWPKRMLWYQIQPVQTYNRLGEYGKAIELANTGLIGNDSFGELHLEKAVAYKGMGDTAKAKEEAEKALFYDQNFEEAKLLLQELVD